MARQLESRSSEFGDIDPKAIGIIENINSLILEQPYSYMHIAEKLCEVKQLVGHGNWSRYREYIDRGERSCQCLMKGYKRLFKASKILKHSLNLRELLISYSALEKLSSKTVTNNQCLQIIEEAYKGGKLTRRRVQEIIYQNHQCWKEAEIQKEIERELKILKIDLLQRDCLGGQADIVTSDAIYEVKGMLTRDNIFQAIGQVLLYRECLRDREREPIDSQAKAIITGFDGGIKHLIPFINKLGVEVKLRE